MAYQCNVLNCGNGNCVHKETDEVCPCCGNHKLIEVTTTGFRFCPGINAGAGYGCDYQLETEVIK